MKIKHDFITNSSSSSFIVIFPNEIKSIDDVKKYMPEWKAEAVFRDAIEQKPIKIDLINKNVDVSLIDVIHNIIISNNIDLMTANEITSQIKNLFTKTHPEITVPLPQLEYINMKIKEAMSDNYEDIYDDYYYSALTKIIEKNNNGYIYKFTYSDESGKWGCEMEHGGTFDELPHITISNH